MRPPNSKSLALFILIGSFLLIWFLTGCEQPQPGMLERANSWSADDVRQFIKRNGAVNSDDHKAALNGAYWQGVEDQAVSQAQLRPIYLTDFRNGKLVVFKPIQVYADTLPTTAEAEALIEATEIPLPKKK